MIKSLLIANRGEIACRIIRTARDMGIRTVAVYSDVDANALHVRLADDAIHIGPSPASESYLVALKIISAAKQSGAEAIHPGYGFLSENADFAQAVIDAGLIWVGPKPASIRAMGLKDAAKERMIAAGVPVTPGYLGSDQSEERLVKEADAIGYPVLIKAVAGGGGKGMRRVDAPVDFAASLESCRREAKASFGNDEVLLEKWITSPRHIEVQVFGDSFGNVVHLFERDCSLQRRHQKVIEEAPAPGMDEATRQEICAAAVRAAKAVDYEGAGTIEFIADASDGLRADRIFFMEMNTRLQVEHPVTEEITGVDLVEWQLRVASGEPIPLKQEDLSINGWAIEARLYAEDPAKGFLPSIGLLDVLQFGDAQGGRIDTGVYQGAEVSPFYDPMIAKVIAHSENRNQAIECLVEMLEQSAVYPVKTNAAFLVAALAHPQFVAGKVDTGLIGRDGDAMAVPPTPSQARLRKAAALLLPKADITGLRLNAPSKMTGYFLLDEVVVEIAITGAGCDRPQHSALVTEKGQTWLLQPWRKQALHGAALGDGAILSPMPGKIIAVDVSEGQSVINRQKLLTLEAMKMEHSLTAPFDGVVTELKAIVGAQVQVETLLVRIETETP
jgi:3-methylcrotonyl-CoA carboxylase alpha subunit